MWMDQEPRLHSSHLFRPSLGRFITRPCPNISQGFYAFTLPNNADFIINVKSTARVWTSHTLHWNCPPTDIFRRRRRKRRRWWWWWWLICGPYSKLINSFRPERIWNSPAILSWTHLTHFAAFLYFLRLFTYTLTPSCICLCIYLFLYLLKRKGFMCVYLFTHRSISLFTYLLVYLFMILLIYSFLCLSLLAANELNTFSWNADFTIQRAF